MTGANLVWNLHVADGYSDGYFPSTMRKAGVKLLDRHYETVLGAMMMRSVLFSKFNVALARCDFSISLRRRVAFASKRRAKGKLARAPLDPNTA